MLASLACSVLGLAHSLCSILRGMAEIPDYAFTLKTGVPSANPEAAVISGIHWYVSLEKIGPMRNHFGSKSHELMIVIVIVKIMTKMKTLV